MKKFKKGFTITELVIVIAVIAVLAAVLIPTFVTVFSKANESVALQETDAVMKDYLAYNNGKIEEGTIFVHTKGDVTTEFVFVGGKLNQDTEETNTENVVLYGGFTYTAEPTSKNEDYSASHVVIYEKSTKTSVSDNT